MKSYSQWELRHSKILIPVDIDLYTVSAICGTHKFYICHTYELLH